jgi:hypothetical protein
MVPIWRWGCPADATINRGLSRGIRAAVKADSPASYEGRQLAIFLSVPSVACAIEAAVAFLRYDNKHSTC